MLARRVCLNGVGALGLMVLLTAPVRAETADPPAAAGRWGKTVELQDVGSGELLWRSPQGLIPLPVLDIDVELTVTGVLLRGTVTQVFHNPTPETIEAIYVFPLPEGASVHRMEMRIGDRRIHSVMQERQQATRTYEHAKATGRKAALLNQHRPNLFSVAVANLNPDETLSVVLDYSDEATYVDGSFELAFPLAYTPRYIPRSFVAGTGEERAALAGRAPNPGTTFPTAKSRRYSASAACSGSDPLFGGEYPCRSSTLSSRSPAHRAPAPRRSSTPSSRSFAARGSRPPALPVTPSTASTATT